MQHESESRREPDHGLTEGEIPAGAIPGGLNAVPTPDEAERIADLHELEMMNSPEEAEFNELVRMASLIAGTQMAMMTLVDSDYQWFKAKTGIEAGGTPRDVSFCGHAIQAPDEPFIVEDTGTDPRFADNPLVTGDPHIGFYAGVPIVTAKGHAVGTICVADTDPGKLSPEQIDALRGLGRQAAALLELRRRANSLSAVLERERNRAAEYAEWQRTHDDLTALPKRELLELRINQVVDAAQLNGRVPTASVVAIEVSGFSYVNSRFGRSGGDSVMRQLAWVLAECLPADALLARTDGTTFAAFIPDADLSLAGAVAHSVHSRLSNPIEAEGVDEVTLSAVIGSASTGDGCAISAADLLVTAETACNEAKSLGHCSTVAAGTDTGSARARSQRMRTALAAALRSQALTVAYMPLVRIEDGYVSGIEALARWRDPDLGQVSPEEFIALAEQHGMVREIDQFVMRTALADFAAGRIEAPCISINVSPAGIDAEFPARMAAALAEAGVEGNCVAIEITERAGLVDSPELCSALNQVLELGVKVALDDFGAGATSVAHLRSLPISHLKIDRSLVSDLDGPDSERARMVVEAISKMARDLGLTTLGEGVERESQAAALTAAGVEYGQGMLFGAPAPLPIVEKGLAG
jgi:diguanylate cyclase (GGDEF)-like protein